MLVRKRIKPDYYSVPIKVCIIGCLLFSHVVTNAQDTILKSNLVPVEDLGDFARRILHKKVDSTKVKKEKKVAILPSVGYNPSLGALIGAKISGLKQLGDPTNTHLSSFGLEALLTSKGVITVQARHNVFKAANKWNIQGNWQFSKYLIADYGIGTGNKDYLTKSDSTFPIKFNFIRLTEGVYRKIGNDLYAGIGVTINIRSKIDDQKLETFPSTPHSRYSKRNGFDSGRYSSNGLLLGFQYNTRDHPLRSYSGSYLELVLRFNPEWLGSSKQSTQFYYDIRKYIGLSEKNPEHVFAIWLTASFRLGGTIPYLELPATAYDMYNRAGRAYTIGRFKGPSYAYYETEYRFPITRNKLLSGVAFFNLQTASDDLGKNIFQYWEPGGGAGLRILLQKQSRSTICFDYARGKYGSSGFFFGLNEAF
ncbi:BamA/TamA family outer membrane protein [Flavitalea sp.]|nr:BamA/TamA family outer membrane protein [Flavitalea sp.]